MRDVLLTIAIAALWLGVDAHPAALNCTTDAESLLQIGKQMMGLTVQKDDSSATDLLNIRDPASPQVPVTRISPNTTYEVLVGLPVDESYIALRAGGSADPEAQGIGQFEGATPAGALLNTADCAAQVYTPTGLGALPRAYTVQWKAPATNVDGVTFSLAYSVGLSPTAVKLAQLVIGTPSPPAPAPPTPPTPPTTPAPTPLNTPAPTPPTTPTTCACCLNSCNQTLLIGPTQGSGAKVAATLEWQLKPKPPTPQQAHLKGAAATVAAAAADAGTVTQTTVLLARVTVPAVDWLAVGFSRSSGMGSPSQPSSVVIGGKGGALAAAAYQITGYSKDSVQPAAPTDEPSFKNMGFEQWGSSDGRTTVTFEMEAFTSMETIDFIIAVGDGDAWGAVHKYAAVFKADTMGWLGTGGGGGAKTAAPKAEHLLVAHGALMTLAWGLLLPVGVLASRFKDQLKENALWFRIHKYVQLGGVVLALLGFIVILVAVKHRGENNFTGAHEQIGLVVTILAIMQPINAWIRPKAGVVTFARLAWEFVHKTLGYTAVFLSWVAIVLGYQLGAMQGSSSLRNAASALQKAFWVFWAATVALGLVAQLTEVRQATAKANKGTPLLSADSLATQQNGTSLATQHISTA